MSDEQNAKAVDAWRAARREGMIEGMKAAAEVVRRAGADDYDPHTAILAEMRRLLAV